MKLLFGVSYKLDQLHKWHKTKHIVLALLVDIQTKKVQYIWLVMFRHLTGNWLW